MKTWDATWTWSWLLGLVLLPFLRPGNAGAQTGSAATAFTNPPIVLTVEGTNVWIQRFRSNVWESAYPNQVLGVNDLGRTGMRSRTAVRLSDLSVMRVGPQSDFVIKPLPGPEAEAEVSLFQGLLRLLNRDRPGKHRFITPTATAATRGTEFVLEVEPGTGRTVLTVFEGEAELSNALDSIRVGRGEQGVAVLGQPPTKTAVVNATRIVQWCLYYPGVLALEDLELAPAEEAALGASLAAYRAGDLLRAVSAYPAGRAPASDHERVYQAALLLAVGQVTEAEAILGGLAAPADATAQPLAEALRLVIAVVSQGSTMANFQSPIANLKSEAADSPATELLARSYAEQAAYDLRSALASARRAVERSPRFAFGWTRVAELEFSQGNIRPALAALEQSLALAPRNAQAVALKGFLLSAQNRIRGAEALFEQAIALDGGLGNAWLGRGLCRIRRGRADEGRFDLQVAAAVEPQRSALRSYLGKAFSNAGDERHAETELGIAAEIDPADPTPSLYSALLRLQQNRVNEAVEDLEHSQDLNDNRRVYRSRLLLDQDRAVRGANLANIYHDAGMTEVSAREAGRAVNADYANYSAHWFLANSYNALRDLKQINLRFETAWFNEYLLANLLAPVGAGTLSQTVSQQEYSKLFERDRLGVASSTEYFSHGEWIQSAAQYGVLGNSSYAAEVFYHADNGRRPNNDLEQFAAVLNLKQQLTPQDSIYVRLNYYKSEAGDVNQYFDETNANPRVRTQERYDPSVLAGYHHEWGPGSHTLFLAGRLQNTYESENPFQGTLLFDRGFGGPLVVSPLLYEQEYRSDLELYTAELQQIWQRGAHAVVAGGRWQGGEFDTRSGQGNGRLFDGSPFDVPLTNRVRSDFHRASVYAYDHWQVCPAVLVAAGVSYDRLEFPENYRYAPLSEAEASRDRVSPKAGLIWTPGKNTTVRAAWFRALGGVSLDQSVRLEPSQVAGFNQAYRSLIPESVVGANAAPTFETWALSLEQKLGRGTFVGLAGDVSSSDVERTVGVVDFAVPAGPAPGETEQRLEFRERTLLVTVNQLVGDWWSVGARYRLSNAELADRFPEAAAGLAAGGFRARQDLEATLHQLHLGAICNHPSGFFAGAGAIWTAQRNHGYAGTRPGDDFWQVNLEAGYRFARRRIELRLGLLNLTDRDYRLNPLNLTPELPRGRTLVAGARFNF